MSPTSGPPPGWARGRSGPSDEDGYPDDPYSDDAADDGIRSGSGEPEWGASGYAGGWPDAASPTVPWRPPAPGPPGPASGGPQYVPIGPPPGHGYGPPWPDPRGERPSRVRWLIAGAVVLLIVVAAGVLVLVHRRDNDASVAGPTSVASTRASSSPVGDPLQTLGRLCAVLHDVAADDVPAIDSDDGYSVTTDQGVSYNNCTLETPIDDHGDRSGSVSADVSVFTQDTSGSAPDERCRDEATREGSSVSYLHSSGGNGQVLYSGVDRKTPPIGQVVMCSGRIQVNMTYYLEYTVNQSTVLSEDALVAKTVSLARTLAARFGG